MLLPDLGLRPHKPIGSFTEPLSPGHPPKPLGLVGNLFALHRQPNPGGGGADALCLRRVAQGPSTCAVGTSSPQLQAQGILPHAGHRA